MKIYIGADHNGFELKAALTEQLVRSGYEIIDEGDAERKPEDDFPLFASKVVHAIKASPDKDPRGILICGSGQGMCMAANRYKGIRASLIWEPGEAHAARNDDDSNVLCLPASRLEADEALRITLAWLTTPFAAAPRYKRRLKELDQLG
jgi:ribose 5-phosphate isomerase B